MKQEHNELDKFIFCEKSIIALKHLKCAVKTYDNGKVSTAICLIKKEVKDIIMGLSKKEYNTLTALADEGVYKELQNYISDNYIEDLAMKFYDENTDVL